VPGASDVLVSHASGTELAPGERVSWPVLRGPGGAIVALDEVRDSGTEQALKLYAGPFYGGPFHGGCAAAQPPDDSWLGLTWDASFARFLGIWLDYGGWPAGSGTHQVALEPTTAPADDLAGAMEGGTALVLPAGSQARWWVRLELGSDRGGLARFLNR
jgi:hypothetical protein